MSVGDADVWPELHLWLVRPVTLAIDRGPGGATARSLYVPGSIFAFSVNVGEHGVGESFEAEFPEQAQLKFVHSVPGAAAPEEPLPPGAMPYAPPIPQTVNYEAVVGRVLVSYPEPGKVEIMLSGVEASSNVAREPPHAFVGNGFIRGDLYVTCNGAPQGSTPCE